MGKGESRDITGAGRLAQLQKPIRKLWREDSSIDQLLPEKRGFGMVLRNHALFPHMTVRQNDGFVLNARECKAAT